MRSATLALLLLTASACATTARAPEPKIVVLVRHAEKASDGTDDPPLTDEGRARALALSRALRDVKPTHLFATQYRRTRETLAPIAEARGLTISEVPAGDRAALIERLKALPPGSVALVAGHTNTLPSLVRELGGDPGPVEDDGGVPAIPDAEHDRFYTVVITQDSLRVLLLRYGP